MVNDEMHTQIVNVNMCCLPKRISDLDRLAGVNVLANVATGKLIPNPKVHHF